VSGTTGSENGFIYFFNAVRLTAKRIPKRADLAGVCGRKWVVSI
jgi:hypothetical protein